jgi:hypothetical protein
VLVHILRLARVALVASLALGCGSSILPADKRSDIVARLDEVRPAVDGMELQEYTNLRWCRNLVYAHGAFSSDPDNPDPDNSTCNLFEEQPVDFDAQATADFAALEQRLSDVGVNVDRIWRRPASEQEGDRLRFTIGQSTFVYSPGYVLPESDPGEQEFFAIDADWYYYWQEWN